MEVELLPAYMFDCPDCGRENFARGLVPSLSEEEIEEMRAEMGLSEFDAGHFMQMPTEVSCKHCWSKFKTKHYLED